MYFKEGGRVNLQQINVKDLRKVLQGDLLCGSEQWSVKQAIYYNRHDLTQSHTLMFVSRGDTINWQEIDRKGPALVISDKSSAELKKMH